MILMNDQNKEKRFLIEPIHLKKIKTSDPAAEEILGYDSQPLLLIMINAIRELTQRVEKLEAQLEVKESEIEALEEKLK